MMKRSRATTLHPNRIMQWKQNRIAFCLAAGITTASAFYIPQQYSQSYHHLHKDSFVSSCLHHVPATTTTCGTSLLSFSTSTFLSMSNSVHDNNNNSFADKTFLDTSQLSPITYYTCRHTYESTLMDEITNHLHISSSSSSISHSVKDKVTSPYPGLVRVVSSKPNLNVEHDDGKDVDAYLPDPVYALQIFPWAVEVEAESINALAKSALEALGLQNDSDNCNEDLIQRLQSAPRGSLTVHTLVPGMLKGSPKPPMDRRARTIGDAMMKQLQKSYPCTRFPSKDTDSNETENSNQPENTEKWILQLLLLSPTELIASISPVSESASKMGGSWPCMSLVGGIAYAEMPNDDGSDISRKSEQQQKSNGPRGRSRHKSSETSKKLYANQKRWKSNNNKKSNVIAVPSSAYRKLLEAISCMGTYPPAHSKSLPVVDLGATPGGWTAALRRMGCKVIAVDRADLAPHLMKDNQITFVKGDAFAFQPPSYTEFKSKQTPPPGFKSKSKSIQIQEQWMVSDIIAFPERVSELLQDWCGNKMAHRMIVTVKFKDNPNWQALHDAMQVAWKHGYECRAKHFFNNKNEVTLMIASSNLLSSSDGIVSDARRLLGRKDYHLLSKKQTKDSKNAQDGKKNGGKKGKEGHHEEEEDIYYWSIKSMFPVARAGNEIKSQRIYTS